MEKQAYFLVPGDRVETPQGALTVSAVSKGHEVSGYYEGGSTFRFGLSHRVRMSLRRTTAASLRPGDYFVDGNDNSGRNRTVYRVVNIVTQPNEGLHRVAVRYAQIGGTFAERERTFVISHPVDILTGSDLTKALIEDGKVALDQKTKQHQLSRRRMSAGDKVFDGVLEALEGLWDECLEGIKVYLRPSDRMAWIDVMDWGSDEVGKKIGKAISRVIGDEARIVWQNEGPEPSGDGWTDMTKAVESRKAGGAMSYRRRMSMADPNAVKVGDIVKLKAYGTPEAYWKVTTNRGGLLDLVPISKGVSVPGGGLLMGHDEFRRSNAQKVSPPYPKEVQAMLDAHENAEHGMYRDHVAGRH